jgi:cytoskeletal protein CcmA (bactofilin family)
MADPTIIDAGTRIDGRIAGEADVTVEGRVEGEIELTKTLTVADGGLVRGTVNVREAHVDGAVDGDVTASERIVLSQTARVIGSLQAPAIVVDDGAAFSGEVLMELEAGGRGAAASTAGAARSSAGRTSAPARSGAGSTGRRAAATSTATTTTTTTTVEEESEAEEDAEAEPDVTEMTERQLQDYTVKELREELRERDLQVSGTKDELIERLQEAGD